MNQDSKNAIALFVSPRSADQTYAAGTQARMSACAQKAHLDIKAFVAIPKTSLKRLRQSLDLCQNYNARTIILDEASTLFLPPKELPDFIDQLIKNELVVLMANTGASFFKEHFHSLSELLRASNEAFSKQRAMSIKQSLRRKKNQGAKLGARRFGQNDNESEIIHQIIDLHKSGKSLQKICDLLASQDIKSVHAKLWHPTTIKRIIARNTALNINAFDLYKKDCPAD